MKIYRKEDARKIVRDRRLSSIDKVKTLCAFLIVCIHAPFPSEVGKYFEALTRIAVPIFFIISGYFFNLESSLKQIKKLFLLLLLSNGIYLVYDVTLAVIRGDVSIFFSSTFTTRNILKFFILNETLVPSHLWYLGAILYVVIIVTIILRSNGKKGRKFLYIGAPIFLMGDLILGKYSLLLLHREFPYILVRNWLFVGLPYFSIGMFLKEREIKTGKRPLIGVIILTTITTLLERWLLVSHDLNATRDHYLSTTFLAVAVFLFFLRYVGNKENLISRIGKVDSTWIYILHPILITVLGSVAKIL